MKIPDFFRNSKIRLGVPKLKTATKLSLFSTVLMTLLSLLVYLFVASAFNTKLKEIGGGEGTVMLFGDSFGESFVILAFPLALAIPSSFIISSLIIDKTLNPIRVMIGKIKAVENKNWNSKIFIDSNEDELVEYAVEFNRMTSTVNSYIQKQKQFVSDVSHELSTPITVILGHADMLLRWGKEDPDALEKGLATIKGEALAMDELVENLLFFARTDSQRISYDMQIHDLYEMVNKCIEGQQLIYPDFDIALNADMMRLPVRCDQSAIIRVIRILLTNSTKYSGNNKKIIVNIESDKAVVTLSVLDYGIGIDENSLGKIFDRFFRADDSRTKETGGTGLGLAIAKEIVQAHGGSITVDSTLGEKTCFSISLPLAT